jgi:UDP-glucose:(heptosyl)LPS alpha-1,3-glucosyltransferase
MKVALVIKHYSLLQGGAERYAVDLSRALVNAGHEVHIVANRYESDGPPGIHFHRVTMRHKPAWLRVISFCRGARRVIAKEDFDVIYALTQIYPQDMYLTGGGVYRHWMRIRYPFVIARWLAYLIKPIHLANVYLERQLYAAKNNRIIIANSLLCKEHVQKYYGVPEDRIKVIYHGVDHEIFNPQRAGLARTQTRQSLGIDSEAPVLLFVSHNWKRKGLSVLLRALGSVRSAARKFELVVVGRGNPKAYMKLIETLGLQGRAHFIGHTDEILRYFGIADMVVLPTQYDSFGNVCIEAMACGIPVVSSSSSGVAELIRNGENGYVLKNADDYMELSNILQFCVDPDKLKKMGHAARETSLAYTPMKNALQTLEVCRQIVSAKNKN